MVSDLSELLSTIAPGRVSLVGHSYGGLVALRELDRLTTTSENFNIASVITLDSPLGGATIQGLQNTLQNAANQRGFGGSFNRRRTALLPRAATSAIAAAANINT